MQSRSHLEQLLRTAIDQQLRADAIQRVQDADAKKSAELDARKLGPHRVGRDAQ
jgi:hypothetical protein